MPVIIPQKIEVIPCNRAPHYRSKGYVFTNPRLKIEVEARDLSSGSNKKVLCECDCCKIEFKKGFKFIENINETYCGKCSTIITCQKKYGKDSPMQDEQIKRKIKKTNQKKMKKTR
jgi:hypothetical protein